MQSIIKSLFILALYILVSCGPTAQEKAAIQQAHDDSIKLATEQMMQKRQAEVINLKKALQSLNDEKEGTENRIMTLKANLEAANDKMEQLKQPQFLRTPEEREKQIKDQSFEISQLEAELENTSSRLEEISRKIQLNTNQLAAYN